MVVRPHIISAISRRYLGGISAVSARRGENATLNDIRENHTDTTVAFTIAVKPDALAKAEKVRR